MPHVPVLLQEAVDGLNLKPGSKVLDATFGGGGHSKEICRLIGKEGRLLSLDADTAAATRIDTKAMSLCRFDLVITNFRNLDEALARQGISKIDAALFDLGLSSFQLEDSGRGFTFQKDEPLRMTFKNDNGSSDLSAEEIVNEWDEENLADIIYGYGGEQFSRRIAKSVVEARRVKPIKTTFDLVKIIESAVPDFYKRRKIHFATKTFQALRITANDELGALKEALVKAWSALNPGGRLAVISFHELEDRIVKRFLVDKKQKAEAILLTKKPIIPGSEEVDTNLRSRSAKLRVAEKI